MKTRMRFSAVVSEAWRDTTSGASRAAVFAAILVFTAGLMACVDARAVVSILRQADTFQQSAAAVEALSADGLVDGRRCDALGMVPGITAAGAARPGEPLRAWNMPSAQIAVVEATPGFMSLLNLIGQPTQIDTAARDGVWLSSDLAATMGARPSSVVRTSAGDATIGGIFTWPDDGRARDLGYVMVVPVPADGVFSSCWAQIWPTNPDLSSLLTTTINGIVQPAQVKLAQLNTSEGSGFDGERAFSTRITAPAPWVAGAAGFVIGFVAVRSRRLEVASSLHARVGRTALSWQHVFEAGFWSVCAALVSAATLLWAARPSDYAWSVWIIGMRTVLAGSIAVIPGAIAAVAAIREKHLFLYSKDR